MEIESKEPNTQTEQAKKRSHIWCGFGNILNDVWRHISLTFGLIFYTKVVGLSSFQAGLLMAAAQISGLLSTAIFGYLCNSVDVPCVSHRLGRKKTWHLVSTVFLACFVLMAFNQCLACNDASSSWVKFAYFAIACTGAAFMFGASELAHLSILPDISQDRDDCVVLNSLRTGFSFFSGISVYIVAWAVLGQSSPKSLTWKDFTIITAVMTGVGLLFVTMFYIGTKERTQRTERHLHTIFNYDGFVSVAIVFGLAVRNPPDNKTGRRKPKSNGPPLYWRILSYLVPFEVPDIPGQSEEDQTSEEQSSSEVSGQSRWRQVSKYLMPYDVDSIVGPLETLVICSGQSEVNGKNEDFSGKTLATEDKRRSVFVKMCRYFFGLSYDQCDGHQVYVDGELDSMTTSPTMTTIVADDDDCVSSDTKVCNSGKIDQRIHAISSIQEEDEKEEEEEEEERGKPAKFKDNETSGDEVKSDDPRQKKVSVESVESNPTENDTLKPECSQSRVNKEKVQCIKTWRPWLKEPNLWKVSFIYVCVRLMEAILYGYLALYLSDYLRFKKEAIANVSLVLYLSFLFGTAATKGLIKVVEAKWTFVFASAVATASAIWFYFLDKSSASNIYLCALLIGCSLSGMTVSALYFVTIVISSHKQSSGFVSAFMVIILKIVTSCYFVVAQTFYQFDEQGSGIYVRYLFAVSIGVLSFLSALMVICFLRGDASPHKPRGPASTLRDNKIPKAREESRSRPPRATAFMPIDLRLSY